jgi:hypothetical protein
VSVYFILYQKDEKELVEGGKKLVEDRVEKRKVASQRNIKRACLAAVCPAAPQAHIHALDLTSRMDV